MATARPAYVPQNTWDRAHNATNARARSEAQAKIVALQAQHKNDPVATARPANVPDALWQQAHSSDPATRTSAVTQIAALPPSASTGVALGNGTTQTGIEPGSPAVPAVPAGLSPDEKSAKNILTDFLGTYGLSGLGDFAWKEFLNGTPMSQIMLDIRKTPEYTTRFPAMAGLAQQGRAVSEAQYINLESSYAQVLHSYGLPAGFYDKPDDFAKLIAGDVSPSEFNSRVKQYSDVVTGDTETLAQLQDLYGTAGHAGNAFGDLLAHYIDPNVAAPLLTEQLQASQFAAASVRSGFGQVSKAQAEQYGAQMDTTPQAAEQGFGNIVRSQQLMQGLPGEGQGNLGADVMLGAQFGGDAVAQEKVTNRARLRVAEVQGGGGFTSAASGTKGVGASNSA